MVSKGFLLAGALALGACGTGFDTEAVLDKRPASWTEDDKLAFTLLTSTPEGMRTAVLAICRNIWSTTVGGLPLSRNTYQVYEATLRSAGITQHDYRILLARGRFGLGYTDIDQTFLGLSCALGYEPRIIEEPPQGAAERWRVDLPDGTTVYLEGDGTPTGMRVVAQI